MKPVDLSALAADPEPVFVEIAKTSRRYKTLPALVFSDGKVLTEWDLTEEERVRLIRGERIRLWVWCYPLKEWAEKRGFPPIMIEVTQEDKL